MSWSEIKYAVNGSLGEVNFKPLDKKCDDIMGTNLIRYGSAIRCIQRGYYGASRKDSVTISFSPINIAKSTIRIYGTPSANSSANYPSAVPVITSWSNSHIVILNVANGGNTNAYLYWEIVEYY